MSFYLTETDIHDRFNDMFVFDLEWIGDVSNDPSRCKMWEIGCIHWQSGDTFRISIMPDLAGDNFSEDHNGSTAVPPVTRESIAQDEHHCSLASGIRSWEAWVRVYTSNPIMVSHNCFAADLPVLRSECVRVGSTLESWVFMDSLSYCRYALRGVAQSYGVSDLCTSLGINPEPHPHRALEDATMLLNILQRTQEIGNQGISGTATTLCNIPLQAISGIGHQTACALRDSAGITCVYELYSAVMQDGEPFREDKICAFLARHLMHRCTETQRKGIAKSAIKWAHKLGI